MNDFFFEICRKAEMEARRKEEEARRLRQEEEDRKAALALQVTTILTCRQFALKFIKIKF